MCPLPPGQIDGYQYRQRAASMGFRLSGYCWHHGKGVGDVHGPVTSQVRANLGNAAFSSVRTWKPGGMNTEQVALLARVYRQAVAVLGLSQVLGAGDRTRVCARVCTRERLCAPLGGKARPASGVRGLRQVYRRHFPQPALCISRPRAGLFLERANTI